MSGHALYRTMLAIILMIGFQNFPFLSGIAVLPIRLALLEWSRKSELSSDRAGLLACQDPDDAVRMFLKASGGTISNRETLNLEAYKEQVSAYQLNDNFDAVFKALNLLVQTHPFHTLRAAALLDWAKSEEYQKILAGDYRRRSERQSTSSYGNDFSEAASYYAGEASKRAGEFSQVAMGAVQQATQFARRTAQDAREAVRDAAEDAAARVSSVIERRK
jgi:hypothetical protein